MGEMDLIPGDFRQGLRKRRQLRLFVTACLAVLACIALGWAGLTWLIWRGQGELARLQQQESLSQQNKARATEYTQQKQLIESQLAALDELRGRDRVAAFLRAIDAAHGEGIWFDSMRFLRRAGTSTLNNLPGATNSGLIVAPATPGSTTQATELGQGVDIVGHAFNHSLLADFMRKLGAQPGIADLRLIDTSLRNYTTTQVIDFSLTLQLDRKLPITQ